MREADGGGRLGVQVFYHLGRIGWKPQIVHDAQQFVVIGCVESGGEVARQQVYVPPIVSASSAVAAVGSYCALA